MILAATLAALIGLSDERDGGTRTVFEGAQPILEVREHVTHRDVLQQPLRREHQEAAQKATRTYVADNKLEQTVHLSIAFLTDKWLVYSVVAAEEAGRLSDGSAPSERIIAFVLLDVSTGEAEVIEPPAFASAGALFQGRSKEGEDLWLDDNNLYIGDKVLSLPAIPARMSDRYVSPYMASEWRTYSGIFLSEGQGCFAFGTQAFPARGERDIETPSNRLYFTWSLDETPHHINLPDYFTGIELTAIAPDCTLALSLYDIRDSQWHVALYRYDALEVLTLPPIVNEHHSSIFGVAESEDTSSGDGIGRFRIIHVFDDDLFLLRRVRPNNIFGSNPELNILALSTRTQAAFLTFANGLPMEDAEHYPSYGSAALIWAQRSQEHSPLIRIIQR